MKILLDTSLYSGFKRCHIRTLQLVRQSTEIIFSSVVAGELLAVFRRGIRFQINSDERKEFPEHPSTRVASVGMTTAKRYGQIYATLRKRGIPISSNDMRVAAQAFETGAELVTMDRHFQHVENLPLIIPNV